jgi:hypothetical protein
MTRQSLALDSATGPAISRPSASWYTEGASDGVGDRLLMFDNSDTPSLELLRFRPDLASTKGFEDALRARVGELEAFVHPAFPQIRAIQHLDDGALALVSTSTTGKRLGEVFRVPRSRGAHPAFDAWLVRDLTTALADLQRHGSGIAHGAVTPERIVLTPDGRLVITEHVLGAALDRLRLPLNRLWRDFGIIGNPNGGGASRLDCRTDIIQLGWIVLSVCLGRRLAPVAYLAHVETLLDEFVRTNGSRSPALVPVLRRWLERALQLDQPFESAMHAQDALCDLRVRGGSRAVFPGRYATDLPSFSEAPRLTPLPDAELAEPIDPESWARLDQMNVEPLAVSGVVPPAVSRVAPPAVNEIAPLAVSGVAPPAVCGVELSAVSLAEPPVVSRVARPPVSGVDTHGVSRVVPPGSRVEPPEASEVELHPAVTEFPDLETSTMTAARNFVDDARRDGRQRGFDRIEATTVASSAVDRSRARLLNLAWSLAAVLAFVAGIEGVIIGRLAFARAPVALPGLPITLESVEAGDTVLVDGREAGVTPLSMTLTPAMKSIRIRSRAPLPPSEPAPSPVAAAVSPADAATAATLAQARAQRGGIRLTTPIELQVLEGERVLGSTADGPIVTTAGRHELDFINTTVGYKSRQIVDIKAGQIVRLTITPPNGRVSANAVPWAQVWIDGNQIGETPLANLPLSVGEHQVTFRHPQFPEQTQKFVVKSDALTRVSATFSR